MLVRDGRCSRRSASRYPGLYQIFRDYLRPSLWTQFTADAIDLVKQAVKSGKVD